jgi:hypothetical protein
VISIDLTGRHLVRCLLDHHQEQSPAAVVISPPAAGT